MMWVHVGEGGLEEVLGDKILVTEYRFDIEIIFTNFYINIFS